MSEGLLVDIVSPDSRTPLGIGSVLHVRLAIIGTFEQQISQITLEILTRELSIVTSDLT